MKRGFALICTLALCIGLTACVGAPSAPNEKSPSISGVESVESEAQEDRGPVDLETLVGVWDDNVYTNEWANFTFTLPDGWLILTNEQISQVLGTGVQFISEGLKMDQEDLFAMISETDIYAFYVMKVNGSGVFAMDVYDREVAGVPSMTPQQFLQQTRALAQSLDNTEVDSGTIVEGTFCNRPCATLSLTLHYEALGVTSKQTYHVIEQGRYLLCFIMGLNDESASADADALLESLVPIQ